MKLAAVAVLGGFLAVAALRPPAEVPVEEFRSLVYCGPKLAFRMAVLADGVAEFVVDRTDRRSDLRPEPVDVCGDGPDARIRTFLDTTSISATVNGRERQVPVRAMQRTWPLLGRLPRADVVRLLVRLDREQAVWTRRSGPGSCVLELETSHRSTHLRFSSESEYLLEHALWESAFKLACYAALDRVRCSARWTLFEEALSEPFVDFQCVAGLRAYSPSLGAGCMALLRPVQE